MARIVIVDDELSQLKLLRDILKRLCPEYEIVIFGESKAAMEYLLEHGTEVLLVDIRMPGMTGFELLSHIPGDEEMMVVVISAHSDFEYARTALRKGVDEYLLKPVSKKELDRLASQIKRHVEEVEQGRRKSRRPQDFFIPRATDPKAWKEMGEEELLWAIRDGLLAMEGERLDYPIEDAASYLALLLKQGAGALHEYYLTESGLRQLSGMERQMAGCKTFGELSEAALRSIRQVFRVSRLDHASNMADSMERCKCYIERHFSDPISLTELSGQVHLSPAYVSSMFKTFTGVGYKEYLTQVRLRHACDMLRQTGMKVYEIARETGYVDHLSFIKSFKKEMGLTPGEYRMMVKGGREGEGNDR